MRASTIHVTNHAYKRWIERASIRGSSSDEEITDFVKKSKVIKRHQDIPYAAKKMPNMVYAVYKDCLFVLEPVTSEEYRLITIINENAFIHEQKLEHSRKKKINNKSFKEDLGT